MLIYKFQRSRFRPTDHEVRDREIQRREKKGIPHEQTQIDESTEEGLFGIQTYSFIQGTTRTDTCGFFFVFFFSEKVDLH